MVARKGTMAQADEEVEPVVEEPEEEPVETNVNIPEEEEFDSYKMDPDEEVWPGGPTFGQVNEWKDKHGDVYVTSVTPTDHIMWRTITRFEYRRMIQNTEQAVATGQVSQGVANLDNEEQIAEMCILFPAYDRTQASGSLAGIASTISQQVMEASGFSTLEVRKL